MYNIVLFTARINKNKMKQTAVEWLKDKIQSDMTFMEILGLINQAKLIDEKNLKDSFVAGAGMGEMFNNENRCYVTDAEKYLKETFKSE